jgi:cyanate permease
LKIKPSNEGKIDILIWVCIYGGLLSIVCGFALDDVSETTAWILGIGGSLVTALGVILIYIRSKTH